MQFFEFGMAAIFCVLVFMLLFAFCIKTVEDVVARLIVGYYKTKKQYLDDLTSDEAKKSFRN